MTSTTLDGAIFFASAHDPYVRRETIHTSGSRFLATISEGTDGMYRVHVFARSTDPQYAGEFWGSVGDPSLTDSLEAARALAQARLENMSETRA
jgi:hypothetical protein